MFNWRAERSSNTHPKRQKVERCQNRVCDGILDGIVIPSHTNSWGLLFLREPRLYSQVGLRGAASPPYKGTVGTPFARGVGLPRVLSWTYWACVSFVAQPTLGYTCRYFARPTWATG